MGLGHRALSDEEAAALDLRAALSGFERLRACLEARRARELLGGQSLFRPAIRLIKTFMFTDIVKSTPLVEAIGDEAWEDLIQWQDKTLRSLFAWHGGQEIDHAGDGFFVAFESASAAIDCAVAIQRALADHRKTHGFSPQLRIGLHATEAARSGGGFRGKGVHQAARIASMAEGGEILVSRTALETEISRYPTSEAKMMNLKGISEPIEVSTIDWR